MKMKDEFFLDNSIIMVTNLPLALMLLFWKWKQLLDQDKHLKYTE